MAEFPTPHAPVAKQTGLAVTTLVFGIIGLVICMPAGVVAIITGIIALIRIGSQPERYGGQGMAIAGLVCGCASLLAVFPTCVSILLPSFSRGRELSKRLVCASNMKAIAAAAAQYSSDLPAAEETWIDWLAGRGYLTHEQTVCPSSGLEVSNYIIAHRPVGTQPREPLDNRAVLVYEPKSNHGGEGGNFLFADGHATFLRQGGYDKQVKAITADDP